VPRAPNCYLEHETCPKLLGRNLFSPNELVASGEIRNIEREIKSKSGEARTLLAHVKRVSIQEGTTLYVCSASTTPVVYQINHSGKELN
ncbi:MAG: hypothetical protein ACREAB_00480, partial [Blastocatellia bacterium]